MVIQKRTLIQKYRWNQRILLNKKDLTGFGKSDINTEISLDAFILIHQWVMSCLIALMGHVKTRDIFHVFVSLTWLSGLIYYMLGQLLETKHSIHIRRHRHRQGEVLSLEHGQAEVRQLMLELGFTSNPKLYPDGYSSDLNLPVFVITVDKYQTDLLYGFLGTFRLHFPGKRLVIYNLGLPRDEVDMIKVTCQCQIRQLQWDRYPAYVQSKQHFHAYRPLLIQETLVEFGIVFWCDVRMRFISSNLSHYLTQAKTDGLVTWSLQRYPTSALTHYNMFRYLTTNQSTYYFQRAAQPDMALLVNSARLHNQLMAPWIHCTLDVDCIAPRGSQPGGCNFMHKPRYMYAGCHHYDVSAYNILLGLMFNMETPYLGSDGLFTLLNNG